MLTCALAGALVFSTTVMGHAADATQKIATRDEAYLAEAQEFKTEVESYVDSVVSSTRAGGHKSLSVPLRKQINGYYCGPASVRMTLLYHGIDQTQSYIAGKIGTTSAGSDVAPMTSYLNSQVGSGSYKYVNVADLAFEDGLIYSIDKGKPLICLVQTSELPYYNKHESYHFIVVKGYDWDMNGSSSYSTVKINDPNNNDLYYGGDKSCTWSEMTKGIKGVFGWYIMGK